MNFKKGKRANLPHPLLNSIPIKMGMIPSRPCRRPVNQWKYYMVPRIPLYNHFSNCSLSPFASFSLYSERLYIERGRSF